MPELGQYAIPVFLAYSISLLLIAVITLVSYIQHKSVMRDLQKNEED